MAAEEAKITPTQAAPAAPAKPVAEKQTNCPACNKPIKKLTRYYRNGKFYCDKKCWRKFTAPKEEKQA